MTELTVVSGFLGAGKTTFASMLLRYFLSKNQRAVYIVNEFGETGLDARIIETEGFKSVEIFGGCVCCTLKGELASSISEVIDTFAPDNIVFEPSGIFVFDKFLEVMERPEIKAKCCVSGAFTIVDSARFNFAKSALYGTFINNQIKATPVIILSKLEKTDKNIDEIICDIRNINPGAYVCSKVWNEWENEDFDEIYSDYKLMTKFKPLEHAKGNSHKLFKSFTIQLKKIFTDSKINELSTLCKSGGFGDVCRIKGIVKTDEGFKLINIVFDDLTIEAFFGDCETTLTFIGDMLNENEIRSFLENEVSNG